MPSAAKPKVKRNKPVAKAPLMDLVGYRNRFGEQAVAQLFVAAGFSVQYRDHVMSGFKAVSLNRARILVTLEPRLDTLALCEMHVHILALKAEHGKHWRRDPGAHAAWRNRKKKKSNGHA